MNSGQGIMTSGPASPSRWITSGLSKRDDACVVASLEGTVSSSGGSMPDKNVRTTGWRPAAGQLALRPCAGWWLARAG